VRTTAVRRYMSCIGMNGGRLEVRGQRAASFTRSAERSPQDCLLDEVEDVEDGHVEGDDHAADDDAEEGDHERLDERGELLGRRLDLLVVELGDLLEHRLQRS